jgi:hypothetical protein
MAMAVAGWMFMAKIRLAGPILPEFGMAVHAPVETCPGEGSDFALGSYFHIFLYPD